MLQTEVQTDTLESAILEELAQVDSCSPDELAIRLADYRWDQVFSTVIQLARNGIVVLFNHSPFLVFISLARGRSADPHLVLRGNGESNKAPKISVGSPPLSLTPSADGYPFAWQERNERSPTSTINPSSPSEETFRSGPEAPTKPGIYWFHSETTSSEMLIEVRGRDGKLTALWPTIEQPVAKLKGHWRGPVPPYLDQVADSHSIMEN